MTEFLILTKNLLISIKCDVIHIHMKTYLHYFIVNVKQNILKLNILTILQLQ